MTGWKVAGQEVWAPHVRRLAYNVHIMMKSTELRRNLFAVLERVVAGDTVEIAYKGSCVRLSPGGASSKLARAKRQDSLLCDPDSIVHSDERLASKMKDKWRKDWNKL